MSAEAEAIFKQIDTDGSSSLDLPEMHAKLSDFGLGEQQIEQIFFGAWPLSRERSCTSICTHYRQTCFVRSSRQK